MVCRQLSISNSQEVTNSCLDRGAVIGRQPMCVNAVRNRISLRKTDVIHAHQHSPPTNELCQYTSYGFAP